MLLLALFEKRLASPGERRGPSWTVREGGLLPLLLIVAVLLCHGVLGSLHQVSCHECEAAQLQIMHHGFVAETGADEGENAVDGQADGLGGTAYAAVVIGALGLVLLGLIGIVRGRLAVSVSQASWRRLISTAPHRPRGPSLPSLQVFRL
jgi:hypothetical protein